MQTEVYSKKITAGSRRTYYVDVKERPSGDVYLVFTEVFINTQGREERSRIQINKEDLQKVSDGLQEALDFVRNDLKVKFY